MSDCAGFSLDRLGRFGAESAQQDVSVGIRAVLRCGRGVSAVWVEKYEQWRNIELTFAPERTILR